MSEDRKPFIRSIKPSSVYPGAKITIEGDCLEMVTKVKVHDQWAVFSKDKGKLKVTIPDVGASVCSITLGWPTGHINNRQCGLPNLLNMAGGFSAKEEPVVEEKVEEHTETAEATAE